MLPQFDVGFFPSQIFWLVLCFGLFFAFVHFYFFPKMQSVFNEREEKIKLERAMYEENMHQIQEIENIHKKMILEAKTEAEEKLKEGTQKAKHFAEERFREIDKTLNEKFETAKQNLEAEIQKFKNGLTQQVLQSTTQIIEKIEETKINPEEVKKFIN